MINSRKLWISHQNTYVRKVIRREAGAALNRHWQMKKIKEAQEHDQAQAQAD